MLEVVVDHDTDTFRGVYAVKFKGAVYVPHAFQKKSKSDIKTPKADLDLIERRLKQAREHYASWSNIEAFRILREDLDADGDAESRKRLRGPRRS